MSDKITFTRNEHRVIAKVNNGGFLTSETMESLLLFEILEKANEIEYHLRNAAERDK